jgi:hypothetical protein
MDSTAIDAFRTTYIRDKFTASPLVALSHYNKATRSVFIDDASILLLEARIENDYAEETAGRVRHQVQRTYRERATQHGCRRYRRH